LTPHLIGDGFENFWISMADVEDAEAAEAVDVRAPRNVSVGVRPGVGPLDDRPGAARVSRLAIFQKAGIDVVSKRLDGLARNPRRLGRRDLALFDQA
jgi:hypothetical protein